MAEPLNVKSVAEEYLHMRAQRCACGGSYTLEQQSLIARTSTSMTDKLAVLCTGCGATAEFTYRVDTSSPDYEVEMLRSMLALKRGHGPELQVQKTPGPLPDGAVAQLIAIPKAKG